MKAAQQQAGRDEYLAREKRWRSTNPLEIGKEIETMKRAGVRPDIIEHATRVHRSMEEEMARKYK